MAGRIRAGFDMLGLAMCGAAAVLFFIRSPWTTLPAVVLIGLALVRALSTRVEARREEDRAFTQAFGRMVGALRPWAWRFTNWVRNRMTWVRERRRYKVFVCPGCHLHQRVPRGQGRIRIRCRNCGTSFEGKA